MECQPQQHRVVDTGSLRQRLPRMLVRHGQEETGSATGRGQSQVRRRLVACAATAARHRGAPLPQPGLGGAPRDRGRGEQFHDRLRRAVGTFRQRGAHRPLVVGHDVGRQVSRACGDSHDLGSDLSIRILQRGEPQVRWAVGVGDDCPTHHRVGSDAASISCSVVVPGSRSALRIRLSRNCSARLTAHASSSFVIGLDGAIEERGHQGVARVLVSEAGVVSRRDRDV